MSSGRTVFSTKDASSLPGYKAMSELSEILDSKEFVETKTLVNDPLALNDSEEESQPIVETAERSLRKSDNSRRNSFRKVKIQKFDVSYFRNMRVFKAEKEEKKRIRAEASKKVAFLMEVAKENLGRELPSEWLTSDIERCIFQNKKIKLQQSIIERQRRKIMAQSNLIQRIQGPKPSWVEKQEENEDLDLEIMMADKEDNSNFRLVMDGSKRKVFKDAASKDGDCKACCCGKPGNM